VPEPIAICIPRDTVNDDTATILVWKVASGTTVAKDQLICEVETSKAVMEIHAPENGVLSYVVAEGQEIPVGATICTIFPAGMHQAATPEVAPERTPGANTARLSAAARAKAAELGIAVSSLPPGKLVRQNDVLRKAGKAVESRAEVVTANDVPVRWEELSSRKTREGRMLQRGRALTVPSVVTTTSRAEPVPFRLPAIIYETARLLRKHPMFNAAYEDGRVAFYEQVNVAWALDGGQGLVVPVIPEADGKSMHQIADCMDRQLELYLENTLTPAEFARATFTVTDLSGQGAGFFHPLIVPGQCAILGVGQGPDELVQLILAFDHQVTEGKRAAEFLQDLRRRLESRADATRAEEPEPCCMVCHRDGKTLQRRKLVLLKSEVPPGLICSLCLAGW
jgi:pyruvate dehydrogenase E2 component (dihydrolipoamide acetyltransferase)